MANYDFKLGEWFKQVEQQEQELKAKKSVRVAYPQQESVKRIEPERRHVPAEVEPIVPVKETYTSTAANADTSEIFAEPPTAIAKPDLPTAPAETAVETVERTKEVPVEHPPVLFGEAEVKPLEDFFSFLDRSRDRDAQLKEDGLGQVRSMETEAQTPVEQPRDRVSLNLSSEGTGEPRPLQSEPTPTPEPQAEVTAPAVRPSTAPERRKPCAPKPRPTAPRLESDASTQEKWNRVPRHLQVLFGDVGTEVAQNSYKTFKESRGELIQRLLDPPITLEEAARVLNVCPTTVRRYTNRGVLKHFRTAGNQRRFRLSDVLSFMETHMKGIAEPAGGSEEQE
jgi:excisionase family DNA binding protein